MADSVLSSRQMIRPVVAWLILTALAGAVLWQAVQLNLAQTLGLADYVAYWAAGRLNALGGNPYSWDDLLALQQPLGWPESYPNMMYYPPWTLALVMPFGILPYGLSRFVWLIGHLALVAFCADRIWQYYGGPAKYRWCGLILTLSFVPTLIVLRMGQIGPILLLGIVGFLYFERRGQDWLAGAALLLPAIKPHLVYLFGCAALIWALDRRRWRVLAGGLGSILAAAALAFAWNPHVLQQYRFALANPPSVNVTPTLGGILRLAFGGEQVWLQYLPTALGLLWFGWYWRRHRLTWSWPDQAPVLLLVSFLTSSYGAWVFDLVVLMVPMLQIAVWVLSQPDRRLGRIALASFVLIDGLALVMNLCGATYPMFIWMTPAILACYLTFRRYRDRRMVCGEAW
jgi:hypothetical protein